MASAEELRAMRRAIALSAHGLGTTSPNPPVGCVILNANGEPIAEGYHVRKGEAHAEGNALRAAGSAARGGTAVVTLEPCNHVGRAPACRQLLIDAGIARVVMAVIDPTSRGEGGVAALRAAGLSVETDVLADEALLVLGPWRSALETSRPTVTWSYALGSDGITGALDRVPSAAGLRSSVDAVLHDDGRIEEGAPGSHGPGMVTVPSGPLDLNHVGTLSELYAGGVRSLLVDGSPQLAPLLLAGDFIGEIIAYLHDPGPSSALPGTGDELLLPAGFRILEVNRSSGYVQVRGQRIRM
ncbi:riboflavin biosynthesis protein RibD [Planomonospora sphaerica]|uniref:diaminohydroxyphosphoribosylaminopyrimidine deaminase n=1 Tax=Planomonospora sphaerica TaxID=161355 RepID=A0A171DJ11_9ACTN|nr:bifunctional diaminohydroxyphosphoribosylaminopyrimidine deaminase/5-amino-6-(5-phosphoribosylamino)uracil reductase RibD [Planomonospora sphaerica]GAT68851.1 riboflavin biosynthesis protein RibD [Planomonospora sphaerica]